MRLKGKELAEARARLFRTSSSVWSRRDTANAVNDSEKEKHMGVQGEEAVPHYYVITISVPWGGTRRYASDACGMTLAIDRAVERDGRLAALESQEMVLIGVKKVRADSFTPPLVRNEVRLLLNTER